MFGRAPLTNLYFSQVSVLCISQGFCHFGEHCLYIVDEPSWRPKFQQIWNFSKRMVLDCGIFYDLDYSVNFRIRHYEWKDRLFQKCNELDQLVSPEHLNFINYSCFGWKLNPPIFAFIQNTQNFCFCRT